MKSQILTSGISTDELLEAFRHVVREELKSIPQPEKIKAFLSLQEASEFLGLSKSSIYRMTSTRQIPHIKRGGKLLFNRQELTAWLQAAGVK